MTNIPQNYREVKIYQGKRLPHGKFDGIRIYMTKYGRLPSGISIVYFSCGEIYQVGKKRGGRVLSPKTLDFGSYIKECRQRKEMNISQLATAADISVAQISRIESGLRKTPKPQTLKALALALETDFEDLMRRAGYFD